MNSIKRWNFPISISSTSINKSLYKKVYFPFSDNSIPKNNVQINRLNCPNIIYDKEEIKDMMDCFRRISKNYDRNQKPKKNLKKEEESFIYLYTEDNLIQVLEKNSNKNDSSNRI